MSFAQVDFSSTRFGLVAGPTYSRVQNAHNPSGARISVQGGVFALIPIGGDDMFYIQPQVEYLGAGEKGGSALYANNYISVPVYFKAYFSEAESEFFGFAGPRFGFLINQKVTNPSKPTLYTVDTFGKSAGFDLAASLGLGFSYKRKWEIFGRFDYGLTNTLPDLLGKEPFDPATNSTKRQHVLNAGIAYIFD